MYSTAITFLALCASFHIASMNPLTDLFGSIKVETPPYTIVKKTDKYEIRRYQSQLWAETDYMTSPKADFDDSTWIGFQPLFRYISGRNTRNLKIPMTAPVIMQRLNAETGQRRMAFIMPASAFTKLDDLPQPSDSSVRITSVHSPLVLACTTFNMGINNKRVAAKEAELREATSKDGINLSQDGDKVRVAGYNPPWTLPWMRTNEICIPVLE